MPASSSRRPAGEEASSSAGWANGWYSGHAAGETPDQTTDEATQLLLLASLLEPATYPKEELRSALSSSRGDLGRAAEELLLPRVKSAGKRKAGTSLESWFGKKRDVQSPLQETEIVSPKKETPKVATSVKGEPLRDAFSILKSSSTPSTSAPPPKIKAAPQHALHLTSQAAIDKHHLPLTLLSSPLSPAFASALYLAMMEESESWERHKWYLAGRWVESPHTMSGYHQSGGGFGVDKDIKVDEGGSKPQYYYSGMELPDSKPYPDLLRQAAELIEPVVNASLGQRSRYPLEWAGRWRANVCGANRYDGASSGVGWHADQLTYLGPYATIASLSLGTPRNFRLRETDTVDPAFKKSSAGIRTYEVNLGHNSLILMNGGCQERYKHTVPQQKALDLFRPGWDCKMEPIPLSEQKAYTTRINITFREDFHPSPSTGPKPRQGTPHCKCGIPTLLRADQKAKARSKVPAVPSKPPNSVLSPQDTSTSSLKMIEDDMAFFWQCQSAGNSGDIKGCGFFRVLDMRAEGRGPCIVDMVGR